MPLKRPGPVDVAVLVAMSAIWGSSFAAIKVAVASVAPLTVAAGRIALAALVLGAWTWARPSRPRREHPLPRGALPRLFAIALFGSALPFSLIAVAEQRLPSSVAGVLMATSPLLALLLSHAFTRDDRLTAAKLLGVGLGLGGVALALGADAAREAGQASLLAGAAVVASAACYAVAGLVTRTVPELPPDAITTRALALSACLIVPVSLALDAPWQGAPDARALLALAWLGLFPTALAYVIRFRQIVAFGYTFVSFAGYLVPVFAVLFGAALLGEPLRPVTALSLALIIAGVVVSRRRTPGR